MQAVRVISGKAVPLDRSDVDTDQIIPAVFLKRVERTGFSEGLFFNWREYEPDFVLDREEHQGANILIAGHNFGTGSSREHAVWALVEHGFQAVISPKFGDIFRNNASKTGLVPVIVSPEVGRTLLDAVVANPAMILTIDVAARTLSAPDIGLQVEFPLDDFTQYRLLEGLDDIGLTLRHEDAISSYEMTRPAWMPSTFEASPGN